MYDAIVVGARCAGSPTAMLLARRGYRVLLVDRATFPSDTLSTHFLHLSGTALLEQWGLLDTVRASGCPTLRELVFDIGSLRLVGPPQPAGEVDEMFCCRRTVLDQILVDAAVEAGAELRQGFTVDQLIEEDGRVVGISGREAGGRSVPTAGTPWWPERSKPPSTRPSRRWPAITTRTGAASMVIGSSSTRVMVEWRASCRPTTASAASSSALADETSTSSAATLRAS